MPLRTAQIAQVGKRQIELSNLTKVLFPADHIVKAQLIQYYLKIAPTILAHLKGRPLSLVRYGWNRWRIVLSEESAGLGAGLDRVRDAGRREERLYHRHRGGFVGLAGESGVHRVASDAFARAAVR